MYQCINIIFAFRYYFRRKSTNFSFHPLLSNLSQASIELSKKGIYLRLSLFTQLAQQHIVLHFNVTTQYCLYFSYITVKYELLHRCTLSYQDKMFKTFILSNNFIVSHCVFRASENVLHQQYHYSFEIII